jgi:hypothetical protein
LVHLVTQFLAEMVVWNHDVPLFWPVITGLRLFRSDSERNRKPAMFVGSKTGDEDAPFVFVRVGRHGTRPVWATKAGQPTAAPKIGRVEPQPKRSGFNGQSLPLVGKCWIRFSWFAFAA